MFKLFHKIGEVLQNSRTRLVATFVVIVGVIIGIWGIAHWMGGPGNSGSATIAPVPGDIQSVPGSQLSQAYLKTLLQSNQNNAEQALQTGGSAIPTLAASPDTIQTQNVPAQTIAASIATPPPVASSCPAAGGSCCCCGCGNGQPAAGAGAVPSYEAEVAKLLAAGKLTPEQAQALLAAYHASGATSPSPDDLVKLMEASGQISPATAAALASLAHQDLTPEEYAKQLDAMVAKGEITPEMARQLLAAYRNQHQSPSTSTATTPSLIDQMAASGQIVAPIPAQLRQLANAGLTPLQYANRLAQMVAAGELTPAQAQQLLADYMNTHSALPGKTSAEQLQAAQDQQQLQAIQAQFAAAAAQNAQAEAEARAQQQQAMSQAMGAQMTELLTSWEGAPQLLVAAQENTASGNAAATGENGAAGAGHGFAGAPLIKLGSILFAVLDTGVNSDRPSPVMATIVSGPYKGAKLMGSLEVTPDKQRVILKFTNMSMPNWPDAIAIQAVAINPDTAQVAIASHVNEHYLLRYGAVFAASFLQGYATAVTNSGQTTVSSNGTTTQTYGNLSPSNKALVGLGQVGTNMSSNAQNLYNTPPTVTVNAGVGLGILFTGSVAKPGFWGQLKHEGSSDGR